MSSLLASFEERTEFIIILKVGFFELKSESGLIPFIEFRLNFITVL
jgi:hypothetical protein